MNEIKILDLSTAGSDLFQDNESFLTELEGCSITQEIMGGSGKGGRTIFYANNFGGGYRGGYGGYRGGGGGYGHGYRGGYGGYGGGQIFFSGGGGGS